MKKMILASVFFILSSVYAQAETFIAGDCKTGLEKVLSSDLGWPVSSWDQAEELTPGTLVLNYWVVEKPFQALAVISDMKVISRMRHNFIIRCEVDRFETTR